MHIDEVLERHTPRQASVKLCLDGNLHREIAGLLEEAAELEDSDSLAEDPRSQEIYDRLAELRDRAEDATVEFVFEAVSERAWETLRQDHPPTDEQREDLLVDYNPDTFRAAAIAVSLVEPEGIDTESVEQLEDSLSVGQFAQLWRACREVNVGGDELGKGGVVTGLMRHIDSSSTTAPPEESLGPSS